MEIGAVSLAEGGFGLVEEPLSFEMREETTSWNEEGEVRAYMRMAVLQRRPPYVRRNVYKQKYVFFVNEPLQKLISILNRILLVICMHNDRWFPLLQYILFVIQCRGLLRDAACRRVPAKGRRIHTRRMAHRVGWRTARSVRAFVLLHLPPSSSQLHSAVE